MKKERLNKVIELLQAGVIELIEQYHDDIQVTTLEMNASDFFIWGCSDWENILESDIDELHRLHTENKYSGSDLWLCRRRNEQPQDPIKESMIKSGTWSDEFEKLPPNRYWTALKRGDFKTNPTDKA
jgi:hypothetical protein